MEIKFTAEMDAQSFKRTYVLNGRHINPHGYKVFRDVLGHLAKIAMKKRAPLTTPIKISVKVYRQRKPEGLQFGDADNHLKAICDALNGICYVDDRQIVDARIQLFRGPPRIEIEAGEAT